MHLVVICRGKWKARRGNWPYSPGQQRALIELRRKIIAEQFDLGTKFFRVNFKWLNYKFWENSSCYGTFFSVWFNLISTFCCCCCSFFGYVRVRGKVPIIINHLCTATHWVFSPIHDRFLNAQSLLHLMISPSNLVLYNK